MKKWYLSKTLWINMVTSLLGVTTAFSASDWVSKNPAVSALVFAAVAGINVLLRFVTNSPIAKMFLQEESNSIPRENFYHHIVEFKNEIPKTK